MPTSTTFQQVNDYRNVKLQELLVKLHTRQSVKVFVANLHTWYKVCYGDSTLDYNKQYAFVLTYENHTDCGLSLCYLTKIPSQGNWYDAVELATSFRRLPLRTFTITKSQILGYLQLCSSK